MSNELKQHYNELLKRQKKAEKWLDSPERTDSEMEKWMPEYKKILAELNDLLPRIGTFTAAEVVHGFSLGKNENSNIQDINLVLMKQ